MSENGTALVERTKSKEGLAQLEQVVIRGDLSVLTEAERIGYYARVCDSLGINPLTRPFEYLTLNNKLVLYARKDATDQLRTINGISIDRLEHERDDALGLAIVTAYGHDRRKRTDSSIGAVNIKGLAGEALANALMKAETKAKRRMTLSLAGLGWLDESEIGSVDEDPAVSHPVVETRREAVASRVAALPEAKESTEYEGVAVDVDDIPFEPAARRQGDPWMRRIHAVGAERGLDHDGIHQLAVDKLGVASLNDLTPYQRADLEELLRGTEPVAEATEVASVAVDTSGADTPDAEQRPAGPLPPAQSVADSDAEVEHAVWGASVTHGLIEARQDPESAWAAIDDIASSALGKDAGEITQAEWAEFAVRVSASEFDPPKPAPRRPKPVTA